MHADEAENAAPRRPSLLPAFEPLSSSPGGLPKNLKRKFDDGLDDRKYYPTPVPTSSTGILPSSSPHQPTRQTRPGFQRTVSSLSERAPLGDVPTLDLPVNGEPILMGRSSNSSDYQLSSNRHISRVHVRASYCAAEPPRPSRVQVECMGWNGIKVHCKGQVVEVAKGAIFESDQPLAQIMVDVQDTRVMLVWPKESSRETTSTEPKFPWTEDSPSKRRAVGGADFASSPPAMLPPRPRSPVSPVPATNTFASTFRVDNALDEVQVYEDDSAEGEAPGSTTPKPADATKQSTPACSPDPKASRSRNLSEPEDFSEHDEENDPIVHSFGPYGADILSRFESFQPASPERKRKPLETSSNSPGRLPPSTTLPADPKMPMSPIRNHVINQLAFSRIHSLPLSTIHSNLPAELRGAMAKPFDTEARTVLSAVALKNLLDDIECVGEISREGKDAAGKLLESEFYYLPEQDADEMRRDTVTQSLGKTSIRAARKSHKQYYWKRPRH